jgi:hypothetical protein
MEAPAQPISPEAFQAAVLKAKKALELLKLDQLKAQKGAGG